MSILQSFESFSASKKNIFKCKYEYEKTIEKVQKLMHTNRSKLKSEVWRISKSERDLIYAASLVNLE